MLPFARFGGRAELLAACLAARAGDAPAAARHFARSAAAPPFHASAEQAVLQASHRW